MPEPIDIHELLRLRGREQPPPGYFETFLGEFHRRQRAELLRRPTWRIIADRLQPVLSEIAASRMAHALGGAALALALAAAFLPPARDAITRRSDPGANPPPHQANPGGELLAIDPNLELLFRDGTRAQGTTRAVYLDLASSARTRSDGTIAPRPASYEPPLSF